MRSIEDLEQIREISKIAYGQSHRLELMLKILATEDGICTLSDLASEMGVSASSLQRPFDALVRLGMLVALPSCDTRFRYYIRTRDDGWTWALSLARRVDGSNLR